MAQTIRTAVEQDLDAIAAVEAECFPAAEAATRAEFAERLRYYGNHFWLLWEDETLAAFVDGMVTDAEDLTDAMYADASLHNENGAWQMIFGVNTLPEYGGAAWLGNCWKRPLRRQNSREERALCSPARTNWCIITPDSALSARAFPGLHTAA